METEIEIDEKLLAEAKAVTGLATDQEVVDEALRTLLDALRHRKEIDRLRGKVRFVEEPDEKRPE